MSQSQVSANYNYAGSRWSFQIDKPLMPWVRCIDWKYALGLELTEEGFDYTVLTEFREGLIAKKQENQLLDLMLTKLREQFWLRSRGTQGSDATHDKSSY